MKIKRGEVYIVDLIEKDVKGVEVGKKRPALVIQSDIWNEKLPSTVVLPLSSRAPSYKGPDVLVLNKGEAELSTDSLVLFPQVRSIDKSRVGKRLGALRADKMQEVDKVLSITLGLEQVD